MSDSLNMCLEKLGIAKLGQTTDGLADVGKVIIKVERLNGRVGYCVGSWDSDKNQYKIIFDPCVIDGKIMAFRNYHSMNAVKESVYEKPEPVYEEPAPKASAESVYQKPKPAAPKHKKSAKRK